VDNTYLKAEELVTGYDDVEILHGVTVTAQEGKATAIIGPNGAGKSTLLKAIYGFLRIKKGRVMYGDDDITGLSPHDMIKIGIGYVPQEISVFPYLTVKENLMLGGWVQRNDRREVDSAMHAVLERFPLLGGKLHLKAGDLSGGEQKMLDIARSLIAQPKVLLVDEPSFGLAPKVVQEVYRKLSELLDQVGVTIVLVDQNVKRAVELADYVYVLEMGLKRADGRREEFEERLFEVIRVWLQV
jgi:branched-chain amino acid transport system ATP-binding protein